MTKQHVIGIDLGGTNVRAAIVDIKGIIRIESEAVNSSGTPDEVIQQIFGLIDRLGTTNITGIGLGVPGPVDAKKGIVYELINIPAWKQENVKKKFESRYHVPLQIQNDANCFALAEKQYGQGKNVKSFIGLIVGTGMAGGIILNNHLYSGPNGMAGEFGMMSYLDHFYEYYCSGQFFEHMYGITAKTASELAQKGDNETKSMWKEFGSHLGKAIEAILYAYDPEMIILGGSVSKSFQLYEKWIWKILGNFAFPNSLKSFKLLPSKLEHPGILGAAALHFREVALSD
jgi:glucokinase